MGDAYEDLFIWQKGMDICTDIYKTTEQFPSEERFGLASQMRRCAVSIPSNIAEGRHRSSKKDFRKFLFIAKANELLKMLQAFIASQEEPPTPLPSHPPSPLTR